MRVAVLGPVEVIDDGAPVDVGTPKQRAILAALVLHRPRAVAVDTLVDLAWGDDPPPSPLSSLHGYISGLRRVVEPRRAARERASVLVTVAPGYALRLPDEDIDVSRFVATVDDVHRRLAIADGSALPAVPSGTGPADLAAMAMRLAEALHLWRGTPFQELEDADAAVAERARQADALNVLHTIRRTLGEELGVDPGPMLRTAPLGDAAHAMTPLLTSTVDELATQPAGRPASVVLGRVVEADSLQQRACGGRRSS